MLFIDSLASLREGGGLSFIISRLLRIARTLSCDFRQAYPGRTPFLEFYERFELLQRQLVQASLKSPRATGAPPSRGGLPSIKGATKEGIAMIPPSAHATEEEAREACHIILESFLPQKFFQIGETRVRSHRWGEGRYWRKSCSRLDITRVGGVTMGGRWFIWV